VARGGRLRQRHRSANQLNQSQVRGGGRCLLYKAMEVSAHKAMEVSARGCVMRGVVGEAQAGKNETNVFSRPVWGVGNRANWLRQSQATWWGGRCMMGEGRVSGGGVRRGLRLGLEKETNVLSRGGGGWGTARGGGGGGWGGAGGCHEGGGAGAGRSTRMNERDRRDLASAGVDTPVSGDKKISLLDPPASGPLWRDAV
jgi:hypothetical protein